MKSLHDYRGEFRAARRRMRRAERAWHSLDRDPLNNISDMEQWERLNDARDAVAHTRHAHSMAIARYIMRRDRELLERLAR